MRDRINVSYAAEFPAPYWIASVELEEGPHLLARYDGEIASENAGKTVVASVTEGRLLFRLVAD